MIQKNELTSLRTEHKQHYVTRQHKCRTHLSEPKSPAQYRNIRASARLRVCGTNQVSSRLISPTVTSKFSHGVNSEKNENWNTKSEIV